MRGLDYLGSEIDFVATEKTVLVILTAQQNGAPKLQMKTANGVIIDLIKGKYLKRTMRQYQRALSAKYRKCHYY